MKRKLSLALACTMALSLFSFAPATMAEEASPEMDSLIEAAKEEGELTVYGSCEEEYLSAACDYRFQFPYFHHCVPFWHQAAPRQAIALKQPDG